MAGLGRASCQRDQAKTFELSSKGILHGEITKNYKYSEFKKDCQYNISTKYSCSVKTSALGLEIDCGQKNIEDFENGCFLWMFGSSLSPEIN